MTPSPDIVVIGSGIGGATLAAALAPSGRRIVILVNLRGGFFLAQRVATRMIDNQVERIGAPYQSIVFVTSVSATMVSIGRAEPCLSKAGASMMAALFAARLARRGIGVFDLRPGIIPGILETGMTAGVRDGYTARIREGLAPAARWGRPSGTGSAALPLVRGELGFVTGAVIPVDGGLSIPRS